ncbi:MAG: hypothetical protein Q8M22_05580 [Actinomycetota bacterium]|nr:hypothetical protein [Actinomycetota bacterium]
MTNDNDLQRVGDSNAASGRSGPNVALILVAIVAAIIVVFVLRNSNELEIDFMFFNWQTTVRWAIFVALVLGVLLDRVFSIWWRRRGKKND